MMINLEVGKYYKLNNGHIVGPMEVDNDGGFFVRGIVDRYFGLWTKDGLCDFFTTKADNAEHSCYDVKGIYDEFQ